MKYQARPLFCIVQTVLWDAPNRPVTETARRLRGIATQAVSPASLRISAGKVWPLKWQNAVRRKATKKVDSGNSYHYHSRTAHSD